MILSQFSMDTTNPRYKVWGISAQERFYFYEWLPAFFERTITLDVLSEHAALTWLFTGCRGRAEVCIKKNNISLRQLYTDSYALYPKDGFQSDNMYVHRHPEHLWDENNIVCGNIKTLTLRYDSHLQLTLLADNRQLIQQKCTLDFTRHQLLLEGPASQAAGCLLLPAINEAQPFLHPGDFHQTIEGFGGIASTLSYHMLSEEGKKRWWQYIRQYNLLIQREYPSRGPGQIDKIDWDNLNEAVPHYYGNNFPVGEISDFAYNTRIQELGGSIWFEFWGYPDFVYENDSLNSQKLTEQILDYCQTAKNKTGQAPAVIGIQNERCESAEKLAELIPLLRRTLDEFEFTYVKLATCNASSLHEGLTYLQRFKKYKPVWDCIDFTASNVYDYQDCFDHQEALIPTMQEFHKAASKKPFLSTEIAINKPPYQEDSYHLAFNTGVLYHNNLTVLDACAICYCWTLMDVTEPSYGFTRTLFTVDTEHGFIPIPSGYILRTFGAFSRHITKGMRRITLDCKTPGILCSGYQSGEGRQTFLFLNEETSVCRLNLSQLMLPGKKWYGELCDQYHENSEVTLKGQYWNLEPGAIFTLYC